MSSTGTGRGKWKNEGSKTVKVGTERDRVEKWLLNSLCTSFVLSIMAIATKKLVHSMVILVALRMLIGKP